MQKEEKKIGRGAGLLIFLGWLMYMTSYIGKVNYAANITQIIEFYGVTKPEAGMVPSFFSLAYATGQLVNGFLCKRYNTRWMVFGSLMVSAIINFTIGVTTNFAIIKWLWLINGFVLSVLWPTLIRLLSENLPKAALGKSSVVIGTTVAAGTLITYGLSSVYVSFNMFKLSFFTAAFAGSVVATIWAVFHKKVVALSRAERNDDDFKVSEAEKETNAPQNEHKGAQKRLFLITLGVLCFCAVGVNLIKDGLTTWVPSILKEEFSITDSISILLTLFLPIVSMFGNAYALLLHKKVPDYITQCFVVFASIAVVIGGIVGSLSLKWVVCMVGGLIVVSFFAASLNSLITSIFPMFEGRGGNSGLYAGLLNSFCYVGTTISSYGLGFIAENFGWTAVFWFLIGFCALMALVWLGYMLVSKIIKKKIKAESFR